MSDQFTLSTVNNSITLSTSSQGITLSSPPSGATTFLNLKDTPSTYVGRELFLPRVNAAGTAIEFVSPSAVEDVDWGDITGDQTQINLSGFTNDAGFITDYTETQTLQDVTDLGANTTNNVTIDRGGLVNSVLNINGSEDSYIRSTATDLFQIGHAGSPKITIGETGNVGIGTDSPANLLTLSDNSTTGTRFDFENTDTGGATWRMNSTGSANTGGAGNFVISEDGVGVALLVEGTTGNVGIGTTSPINLLHIQDSPLTGLDPQNDDKLVIEHSGNYANINIASDVGGYVLFSDGERARGGIGYVHSGDYLVLRTSGAEKMRIDSDGNVGIGTTSPSGTLHLTSTGSNTPLVLTKSAETGVRERLVTATVTDDATTNFFINNGTIGNGSFAPVFGGYTESTTLWPLGFGGYTSAAADATDSSTYGLLDFAAFRTTNGADALNGTLSDIQNRKIMTVRNYSNIYLTIDADGNTGIGETAPSQKLDVAGNIRAEGYINPTSGGSNSFFGTGTLISGGAGSDTAIRANSGALLFSSNGNQEKMRISSSGNVGIGTSTPSARLHAISTTEQLRAGYNASNYFSTTVGSTGATTFNAVGSGAEFLFSDSVSIGSSPAYTQSRLLKVYDNGDSGGARVSIIGTTGISNTPAIEFVIDGNASKRSLLRLTNEGSNNYGLDFVTTSSGAVGIRGQMNGNGNWLFGEAGTASARLHAISTTEQLRIGYDDSNYMSVTTSSTGAVTFNAVGSGARFVFSDGITLPAGTATAGTSPLKLTSGTNLTTPENGAFEFDGTNLYFTVGGVRKTVTLT